MIHAQTARLAGELVLWGLVVGCGCLRVARGLAFTRRARTAGGAACRCLPSGRGCVRGPLDPQCFHSSVNVCLKKKEKKKERRRHRRDAVAAAPAGVRGLLASHNGGSRGAAYLSAAGGLPGDKNTIHVYGNPPPLPPTPPVTHVLVCNLL